MLPSFFFSEYFVTKSQVLILVDSLSLQNNVDILTIKKCFYGSNYSNIILRISYHHFNSNNESFMYSSSPGQRDGQHLIGQIQ